MTYASDMTLLNTTLLSHGIGVARGLLYARDGRLVASVVQDGMIRQT